MKALLYILLLATCRLQAAEAPQPQRFDFDLPAAALEQALQRFNGQSGASVGIAGELPALRTRAVAGRYTALEALQRMLAGSGIDVVAVGPLSYRLQRAVVATVSRPMVGDPPLSELAEVLVTATKRSQPLLELPLSLTVVDAARIGSSGPLPDTRAALDFDAATSSTNLGPGRNRHFIRGVADSAFLGPSQATVSIQFDETRLNYSAPDPDLRLLDVERVEILKGPQGPLYGTGALGGVLHILPERPDLGAPSLRVSAYGGSIAHGGTFPGGSVVLNLPLARDAVALRAAAYVEDGAGWIDNAGARSDANGTRLAGGRLAVRARGAGGWLLDLQGVVQDEHVRDSQYVPGAAAALTRSGLLPEPRDNDLGLVAATLHGPLWGGELTVSSSYVRQEVDGVQDASAAAMLFGITAPARYDDERDYRLLANELRFSATAGERVSWLAGVSQLGAHNRIGGRVQPAPASGATVLDLRQHASDLALFGEVVVTLPAQLRLTVGLRAARLADEDERREAQSSAQAQPPATIAHSATPSISLDWHSADRRSLAYLRIARAVRPGGLNPDRDAQERTRFNADELSSLDLGLRIAGDMLSMQTAVFATRWRHVQSDYLQASGLIGTRNVGDASNLGAEMQLRLAAREGWSGELGTVLQRARLEHPVVATPADDPRLPVVPDLRLFAVVAHAFAVGNWQARLQLRGDYVGSSRLSFDADLDRDTPASFALGANASLVHGPWELRFTGTNLLDSRADTFAFGNQFSVRTGPQRTPRRPRTLMLELQRSW